MTINQAQFAKVVEAAKAKTNDRRWPNAIDKSAAGILGGAWIITELAEGIMVTTESGETYRANGVCQCKAFDNGQACKHRAAARLIALYNDNGNTLLPLSRADESDESDKSDFEVGICRTGKTQIAVSRLSAAWRLLSDQALRRWGKDCFVYIQQSCQTVSPCGDCVTSVIIARVRTRTAARFPIQVSMRRLL